MTKIKFSIDLIKFISLFETTTRSKVKDIIENETLTFVVEEGEIGKAIGKGGINIKKISDALKRRIKVVEFSSDPCRFVRNYVHPLKVESVEIVDNVIIISDPDTKTKGLIIGRDSVNLKKLKSVVSRYFKDVQDIKVG